jgi:hypothetical protein
MRINIKDYHRHGRYHRYSTTRGSFFTTDEHTHESNTLVNPESNPLIQIGDTDSDATDTDTSDSEESNGKKSNPSYPVSALVPGLNPSTGLVSGLKPVPGLNQRKTGLKPVPGLNQRKTVRCDEPFPSLSPKVGTSHSDEETPLEDEDVTALKEAMEEYQAICRREAGEIHQTGSHFEAGEFRCTTVSNFDFDSTLSCVGANAGARAQPRTPPDMAMRLHFQERAEAIAGATAQAYAGTIASPGCEVVPATIRFRERAEALKHLFVENNTESHKEKAHKEHKEKAHKEKAALKEEQGLSKGMFWNPVRDFNGGKTLSPLVIRQQFTGIVGSYGVVDTTLYTYWSVNRYPAAQNGSKITIDHLCGSVSPTRLETLTMQQKCALVDLLEQERRVIRNITSQFIRNHAHTKARNLQMKTKHGISIRNVKDILTSMVDNMTRLNWAKGFVALKLQFQGREWVDDLQQQIMDRGFGSPSIRYYEKYDMESEVKLTLEAASGKRSAHCVPSGKQKAIKFDPIANVEKRKFYNVVKEFELTLARRTGIMVDWASFWKKCSNRNMGLSTDADMEAIGANLVFKIFHGKSKIFPHQARDNPSEDVGNDSEGSKDGGNGSKHGGNSPNGSKDGGSDGNKGSIDGGKGGGNDGNGSKDGGNSPNGSKDGGSDGNNGSKDGGKNGNKDGGNSSKDSGSKDADGSNGNSSSNGNVGNDSNDKSSSTDGFGNNGDKRNQILETELNKLKEQLRLSKKEELGAQQALVAITKAQAAERETLELAEAKQKTEESIHLRENEEAKAKKAAEAKALKEATTKANEEAKAKKAAEGLALKEAKAKASQEAKAKKAAEAKALKEAKAKASQEAKAKKAEDASVKAKKAAEAKALKEVKAKASEDGKAKKAKETKALKEAKAEAKEEAKANQAKTLKKAKEAKGAKAKKRKDMDSDVSTKVNDGALYFMIVLLTLYSFLLYL